MAETRLILLEDLHVPFLVQGCPVSRWMFSEPDILQIVLLFPSTIGNMKFSPFWSVITSFALSLLARILMRQSFPIPQCLRPKCLLSRFLPRSTHIQGIYLARLFSRTDAVGTVLLQK